MAGVDLVHVPYRANYMPDLLSNQVQMAINPIPQALALIRDGKLTVLAVTTKQRLGSLSQEHHAPSLQSLTALLSAAWALPLPRPCRNASSGCRTTAGSR